MLIAMALLFVVSWVLNTRIGARIASGRLTVGPVSRVVAAAWTAVSLGIFTLFLATAITVWQLANPKGIWVINSIVFTVYGMAWFVSAVASGVRWMRWTAYGCFLTAIVVAFVAGSSLSYPIGAAGLFLFAVLPGIALVRNPSPRGT